MNPIILLSAVLVLVSLLGGSYVKGRSDGRMVVQSAWDKATAEAVQKQREKEQAMQAEAAKFREEKNREIRLLTDRAAALSNSLRQRPNQSQLPKTAEAGPAAGWCTGTGLYREHAEFLVGEAAAAQQCRAYLAECRQSYNSLMKD